VQEEEKKAEPEPVVIEEPPMEPVKGLVTVKYNHYKEKFPIIDGVLQEADIDEQYYFSGVFKGNYQLLIRQEKDTSRKYFPKPPDGSKAWLGLEDGGIYIVEIEEDNEAEAERRKNAKPIEFYKPEEKIKKNGRIDGLTNQLKGMSIKELEEKDDKYKELIEARDLEDILYK
jgi:hypothetical protein